MAAGAQVRYVVSRAQAGGEPVVFANPGVVLGDLLIGIINYGGDDNVITPPTGFSYVIDASKLISYKKIADSGDVAAADFSFSVTGTFLNSGGVFYVIKDHSSGTTWANGGTSGTDPFANISASITPDANSLLIMGFGVNNHTAASKVRNFSIDTSNPLWINDYDAAVSNRTLSVAHAFRGPGTATGNLHANSESGGGQWYGIIIGVKSISTPGLVRGLIVGGGGGGGMGGTRQGGGGGAGQVIANPYIPVENTGYSIVVGTSGAGATGTGANGVNGGNATGFGHTAVGGGGGASGTNVVGSAGANGGGGAGTTTNTAGVAAGGAGTSGPDSNYGNGRNGGGGRGNGTSTVRSGGGGGGSGGTGSAGGLSTGGGGGNATSSDISGAAVDYGGGGGGGGTTGGGGTGGGGNGGSNGAGAAGAANRGGGGGGSNSANAGGAGAVGPVIISYNTDGSDGIASATGGTITTSGGKTIHTFTSNGTFTPVLVTNDTSKFFNFF